MGPRTTARGLRSTIGAEFVDLVIDTGSIDALSLSHDDAQRLLAAPESPIVRTGTSERAGYFGKAPCPTYHIASPVSFGEVQWHTGEAIGDLACSSLGSPAFTCITLDIAREQVTFESVGCVPPPR